MKYSYDPNTISKCNSYFYVANEDDWIEIIPVEDKFIALFVKNGETVKACIWNDFKFTENIEA